MGDILIRNVGEDVKRALSLRAARNGRSQQAEARAIIEDAVRRDGRSWAGRLYDAARAVNGVDLDLPSRHRPREIDSSRW